MIITGALLCNTVFLFVWWWQLVAVSSTFFNSLEKIKEYVYV